MDALTFRGGTARRLRLPLVAAALLSGAAACEVSPEEERALGEQTAREIEAQLPIVEDPAVDGYIEMLGDSIAAVTDRPDLDWSFSVVDAPEVNAFAVPGGHIYVNRGLIEATGSLSQLVGVLGHEIAHVTERHAAEQLESERRTNVGLTVVCTLTDLCASDVARVAINVGGAAYFARHSREDEAEADSVGILHITRAGFDPRGVPSLFEVLLAERARQPALFESWFGTHPLEEERIEVARRVIEGLDPALLQGLRRDDPSYHAFLDRLRSLPPSPRPAGP